MKILAGAFFGFQGVHIGLDIGKIDQMVWMLLEFCDAKAFMHPQCMV